MHPIRHQTRSSEQREATGPSSFAMSAGRLDPFHSELIAAVPAIGGSVLLLPLHILSVP